LIFLSRFCIKAKMRAPGREKLTRRRKFVICAINKSADYAEGIFRGQIRASGGTREPFFSNRTVPFALTGGFYFLAPKLLM